MSPGQDPRAARRGPRAGGSDTRAQILVAAREEFADRGYSGATVRSIGARAGVDAAMINHYYGGKAGLFREVIALPEDPLAGLVAALDGPPADRGRQLVRLYLGLWEQPDFREPFLAVLRSAEAEPRGGRMLREYLLTHMLPLLREHVHGPDPTLQISLAMTHVLGIAIGRHVLRLDPLVLASIDELADQAGPVVGRYLDGTHLG